LDKNEVVVDEIVRWCLDWCCIMLLLMMIHKLELIVGVVDVVVWCLNNSKCCCWKLVFCL